MVLTVLWTAVLSTSESRFKSAHEKLIDYVISQAKDPLAQGGEAIDARNRVGSDSSRFFDWAHDLIAYLRLPTSASKVYARWAPSV